MSNDRQGAVAIIGGSPDRFYTQIVRKNLALYGQAQVYLVNPRFADSPDSFQVASVADVPTTVALGIIQLRAELVAASVAELADKGCRTAVVFSDGFADAGTPHGRALQDELTRVSLKCGVTLVGPNSMGYADFSTGLVSIAGPITDQVRNGGTTIVSDSGALLSSMLTLAEGERIGVDRAISVGNGAAMPTAAWINQACGWATTTNLWVYSEGLHGDVYLLEKAVRRFLRDKGHIYWYLSGVSDAGQRAAQSHTGRMTPPQSEALTFLEGLGVVVFQSLDVLARASALPAGITSSSGAGVAVLSSSGGGGVAGADAATRAGVPLVRLSPDTHRRVSQVLGRSFEATNPFDFTAASGDVDAFEQVVRAFAGDDDVNALVYAFPVQLPGDDQLGKRHTDKLKALAASARPDTPVIVAAVARQPLPPTVADLVDQHENFCVTTGLDLTLEAIAALQQSSTWQPRRAGRTAPAGAVSGTGDSQTEIVEEARALEALAQAGLVTVPTLLVADVEQAAAAARRWDQPVVAKGVAEGLAHKQGAGLVAVNLRTDREVREASSRIFATLEAGISGVPSSTAHRILVQPFLRGLELFVAARRAQLTGKVDIVFGLGGKLAEASDHVSVGAAPPVASIDADKAVAFARAAGLGPLLDGAGSHAHSSLAAAMTALVGYLEAAENRDVVLAEINPLIVLDDGSCVAVDALIVRQPSG